VPAVSRIPAVTKTAGFSLQATYPQPPRQQLWPPRFAGRPSASDVLRIELGTLTARRIAQILARGVSEKDVARILHRKLTERDVALILAGELTEQDVARLVADHLGLESTSVTVGDVTVSGYRSAGHDALRIGELANEMRFLASSIAIAQFVATVMPELAADNLQVALRERIEGLSTLVRIRRLRYESPLELALIVPPAVFAATSALAVLIFSLKRMYTLDLEFRTHREERRAAFLEAKKRSQEAERAWRASEDPESWPPELINAILTTIEDTTKPWAGSLKPNEIVLVDEDDGADREGEHRTA
jgi:hypothetical protein